MAKTTYADYAVYAKLRDERKYTDYFVAQSADVSTATMTNWKQGAYTPKADKLLRIARVLEVPLEALLTAE